MNVRIGTPLADAQKQIILGTLTYCGGDKRRAAKALGVSLKTLYNRLGAYENEGAETDAPSRRPKAEAPLASRCSCSAGPEAGAVIA